MGRAGTLRPQDLGPRRRFSATGSPARKRSHIPSFRPSERSEREPQSSTRRALWIIAAPRRLARQLPETIADGHGLVTNNVLVVNDVRRDVRFDHSPAESHERGEE